VSERENLFRPIHKGLRAMIYNMGAQLQSTDFADVDASNAMLSVLAENLDLAVGNCALCLLYAHSKHEEDDFFRPLRPIDPDVVALMMKEHAEVGRRVRNLSSVCEELKREVTPARRIEVGDRVNQDANDLFAYYLQHMNNEEATMVPVMWEHFTDEQLRRIRADYHLRTPPRRFEVWMRWTLPALNLHELVVLFRGLKEDGPPELLAHLARLANETVDPTRWAVARDRAGL
jgi:Hemerythrin HHE cation binding domain